MHIQYIDEEREQNSGTVKVGWVVDCIDGGYWGGGGGAVTGALPSGRGG